MRFAGIDIASETHVVAMVDEDGKVLVKATPFAEDAAGYEKLFALLGASAELLIAMEATGHYWKNLFAALAARGLSVALLNPLRTHRFAGEDLERTKTDAIDALGIARFAAQKRPNRRGCPTRPPRSCANWCACASGCCRTSAIACASCTAWSISASPSSPATCAPR